MRANMNINQSVMIKAMRNASYSLGFGHCTIWIYPDEKGKYVLLIFCRQYLLLLKRILCCFKILFWSILTILKRNINSIVS